MMAGEDQVDSIHLRVQKRETFEHLTPEMIARISAYGIEGMVPEGGCLIEVIRTVRLGGIVAARIAGASPIIAVDVNDSRLELAVSLRATHTINGERMDTHAGATIKPIPRVGEL